MSSALEDARAHLATVVKTYDVRGLVGAELTEEIVTALAAGFVDEIGAAGSEIVVGHDMRESSPGFAAAFARGAQARGASVVSIGLCATDETYFASGDLDLPAVMFTASHNPASYNGIKFCRAGALGMSLDTGLSAVRDRAADFLGEPIPVVGAPGASRQTDVLPGYAARLRGLVDLAGIRPLRVVVDAGNGMAGLTVPAVLGHAAGLPALPLEIIPLFFDLDGSFPNHVPNPLEPENLVALQAAVLEHGADLGLAFDGDADRCILVDEAGQAVDPSAVGAIIALREINRLRALGDEGDILVIHNALTSRVVEESIEAVGAIPVRTPVGHSIIKAQMRETGAVFGAEHSGHYYFREFWGADCGMLAALQLLAELGHQTRPLSEISEDFTPYALSGEINLTVEDVASAYASLVDAFTGRADFDEFEGLTVTGLTSWTDPFWWFNVRASNTEPLLRLNVEGGSAGVMAEIRDEVLAVLAPLAP